MHVSSIARVAAVTLRVTRLGHGPHFGPHLGHKTVTVPGVAPHTVAATVAIGACCRATARDVGSGREY